MKSTKILSLAVVAATFLSATSVFAYDEVSAEDKERAYKLICVPGSEAGENEKDAADAVGFRSYYHTFLRNPEAIQPVFADLKKGGNGIGGIGLAIQIAATCGATDLLKDAILARGCSDESGKAVSITKALEVCAPINEWIKSQEAAK